MSGVKVISFSQKGYSRILQFLYPSYSVTSSISLCRQFIVEHDVVSRQERELLDMDYEDCIFISSRVFDEMWDEDVIRREVLACAKSRFGSRKRQFTTVAPEGDAFIDECISFLFLAAPRTKRIPAYWRYLSLWVRQVLGYGFLRSVL